MVFPQEQTQNLKAHIEACGFEATPEILARLGAQAAHWRIDGWVLAAHIYRALKLVQGTSNAPQKPAWIFRVVENACKDAAAQRKPMARESGNVAARRGAR